VSKANEDGIRGHLARWPSLKALVPDSSSNVEKLAEAWQTGATHACESHPFISLLVSDAQAKVRAVFEAERPGEWLSERDRASLEERLVCDRRGAYNDNAAAVAELYAACCLHRVGAKVILVPTMKNGRTPDLVAERDGATATLEATGIHLADKTKAEQDATVAEFSDWRRGTPMPDSLYGKARDYGNGVRMVELSTSPYGTGTLAQRVDRMALKLRSKANGGQLADRPNGILVVSFMHAFGPGPMDLQPVSRGGGSAILHEALFGRTGNVLCEAETFEGEIVDTWTQREEGLFVGHCDANAVLWLFHDGSTRLSENPNAGLDAGARTLVRDAFDL
jgi:hypothetical protein